MTHTLFANVEDGVAGFDTNIMAPLFIFPFIGTPGRAELYSATGTALSTPTGASSQDRNSIRLFYDASGQPIYLNTMIGSLPGSDWNVDPATAVAAGGQRAGGYLGRDRCRGAPTPRAVPRSK